MNYELKDDPRQIYGDIIDLPHHQSPRRKQMSLHDRAAQFAPFAALVGYDEMVDEEARLTDQEQQLSEDERLLQADNDWLRCFNEQRSAIERG